MDDENKWRFADYDETPPLCDVCKHWYRSDKYRDYGVCVPLRDVTRADDWACESYFEERGWYGR